MIALEMLIKCMRAYSPLQTLDEDSTYERGLQLHPAQPRAAPVATAAQYWAERQKEQSSRSKVCSWPIGRAEGTKRSP